MYLKKSVNTRAPGWQITGEIKFCREAKSKPFIQLSANFHLSEIPVYVQLTKSGASLTTPYIKVKTLDFLNPELCCISAASPSLFFAPCGDVSVAYNASL